MTPLITVVVTTYNHRPYINRTLDSILKQKTDFKYEIVIHDDASTDGTRELVESYRLRYPGVITVIYQEENQYSKGKNIWGFLESYLRGTYVSVCEGDDFWINENKLQIQAEYMIANPQCSLCVHSAYFGYENGKISSKLIRPLKESGILSTERIVSSWSVATASVMYKTELREGLRQTAFTNIQKQWRDWPLAIYLSLKGTVYYFDIPMSVYRLNSVTSVTQAIWKNTSVSKEFLRRENIMLQSFDEYTCFKYHSSVEEKIKQNIKTLERYLSPFERLRFFVRQHFPGIYQILQKLKRYPRYCLDSHNRRLQDLCIDKNKK